MSTYMQSSETVYKDGMIDYEYDFYASYLSRYINQESETGFIKVSDDLQENFMNLSTSYHNSNSVHVSERGMEDKLADSFTFYVSLGVIVLREDGYYINTKLLASLEEKAKKAKQFDSVIEKGESYKKGGIK